MPGGLQSQDHAAGVAHDAGGDVQQPVAQRLRFGDREGAVQQQRLGEADQVLGGEDQLQPDGIAPEPVEGEVAKPGGLGGADAVLDPGALAVAQLQAGEITVGLVGEEHLEAVAVHVGEAQLGAGWASSRRQLARVPGGQVCRSIQPVSSHTSAPARAWPSASMAGSRRARDGEDRLAHVRVDLHAEGDPHATVAQVPGELGAAPGAVGADQDRLLVGGQLREGELDQVDQVAGGSGGGVAWAQQAGQWFPRRLPAVQVGQQRVEPKVCL